MSEKKFRKDFWEEYNAESLKLKLNSLGKVIPCNCVKVRGKSLKGTHNVSNIDG